MATIRTLNVSIKANTKKAEEGFKKLQKSNENLMASFATSAKVVAGFGVALGVAAAAGLTSFVKNSMESIDAQAKLADRLGGTIDGLRALQFIAGQSGSSSDALNNGLEKMVKNFGDAMRGTGEAKDALQGMGLSVQALAKMRPERAFMLIGDALKGMKSPAEQASAAQAIFGRGGQELLTTLLQGSEAIEEQSSAFIKLAGSISKVDASKVQAANDAIGEARKAVEGLGDRIAIAAAPAIKALADSFTKWAVEAKPSVDSVNTAISDTVRLISFAADGMRLLAAGWNLVRAAADKAAEVQAKTLGLFTEDSARGAGLRGMASSLAPQLSMAGHLGNLLELSQFFKQSGSLAASQAADNFERAAQHWSDLVNGKSSNALLESIAKINAESAKLSKSLQPKQTSRVQGGQSYAGIGNALPSMSAGRVLGDQLQAHLLRAVAKVQTPMFMLGKTLGQGIEASIALAKNHLQSMQDFADSVKESLKTPLDHFKDFGAQLAESVKLGLLSGTEAAQALGMEKERLLGDQSQSGPGFGALREIDLSRIDPGALSRQGKKTQEVRSKQLEEANKLHRAILEAIRKNSSMAVLG
ncbi:MAG: hypothetical protein HS116_05175 [Planctomycetes bacterium]|nr:hypothetical protein [Planctomycetota bacterium]